MRAQLEQIKENALKELRDCLEGKGLDALRVKYLGKKGELTAILKQMGKLSAEERPVIGQVANEVRQTLEAAVARRQEELKAREMELRLAAEKLDVTMPGKVRAQGGLHPLSIVQEDLIDIFRSMGFDVVDGPEVETDYYCFEALERPQGPPRPGHAGHLLSRARTCFSGPRPPRRRSGSWKSRKPPIRIVCPGRVYRADDLDATHSPIFHQMEGLVVDKGITMCDLKGCLEQFVNEIYGAETQVRFRPSFFPFTEPSVEVDVSCSACGGKGCRVCKGAGWIEILGGRHGPSPRSSAGCGIDPEVYTGFAFGIGLDRLTTTPVQASATSGCCSRTTCVSWNSSTEKRRSNFK